MDESALAAWAGAAEAGVDLAFAVAAGALASTWALGASREGWCARRRAAVARWHGAAAGLALVLVLGMSWLRTISFTELDPLAALAQVPSVAIGTQFGRAWTTTGLALAALGLARPGRFVAQPSRFGVALLAAAVYAGARAWAGHTGAQGAAGDIAVMAIHLSATATWAGIVVVTAVAILPDEDASAGPARSAWVGRLSATATVALALVVASGAWIAWRATDGFGAPLRGTPWFGLLLAKLVLVGLAAALGAFNRFFGLPPLRVALAAARVAPGLAAQTRFTRVLRVEAGLLVGALLLGAAMASVALPGTPG